MQYCITNNTIRQRVWRYWRDVGVKFRSGMLLKRLTNVYEIILAAWYKHWLQMSCYVIAFLYATPMLNAKTFFCEHNGLLKGLLNFEFATSIS